MKTIFARLYFLETFILLLSLSCYAASGKWDALLDSKDSSVVRNDKVDWRSLRCDSIKIIPSGKIKSISLYSYDGMMYSTKISDTIGLFVNQENGRLKGCDMIVYDSLGNVLYENKYGSTKNYFYTDGKLVKEVDTTETMFEDYYKITSICLLQYNEKQQCIKKSLSRIMYGERGQKKSQLDTLFTYDERGNLKKCSCVQDKYGWCKYEYDSLNRQTRATYCNRFDGVRRIGYSYDVNGNKIEEKIFAQDTTIQRWVYNASGTIKEDSTIDNEGELTSTGLALYFYDKFGNVIYAERYYADSSRNAPRDKWESKITYDTNGNWVRKVTYHNGEVWEVKTRVITYF